jgi:hypothetical protein
MQGNVLEAVEVKTGENRTLRGRTGPEPVPGLLKCAKKEKHGANRHTVGTDLRMANLRAPPVPAGPTRAAPARTRRALARGVAGRQPRYATRSGRTRPHMCSVAVLAIAAQ